MVNEPTSRLSLKHLCPCNRCVCPVAGTISWLSGLLAIGCHQEWIIVARCALAAAGVVAAVAVLVLVDWLLSAWRPSPAPIYAASKQLTVAASLTLWRCQCNTRGWKHL